ncbi:hypothetical protein DL96DRAFT_1590201 [Flagelloscypha sp. PMI_526]|nr:hypothetical protein DL96DRAFT_1590201 [Flagelloscypha sp. PMI_526]
MTDIQSVFLPSEIVDSIVCQVSDTPTLLSCSIISRQFRAPSQAQIFRYVGREPLPDSGRSYKDRVEQFGTIISRSTSTHLRKLVYALRLKEDLLQDLDAVIFPALALLPNINILILSSGGRRPFRWSRLSLHARSTLEDIIFPRLRSLTVRRVIGIPFSKIIEQCPTLKTLEVVMCNLRRYDNVIYRAVGRPYTPEPGSVSSAQSLQHLKLWGQSLTDLNSDPEWVALNTGSIKSLTIGRNLLDRVDDGKAVLIRIIEKNQNSLECVKILNYSFVENADYFDMFYRLPNLKLLFVHLHWSVYAQPWATSYVLQPVTKLLMDSAFTTPTLHLLLSNVTSGDDGDNEFDPSSQDMWVPLDNAIHARPEVKLILSLRETLSEGLSFNEMKTYIEVYLGRSSRAGLLDVRQYDGPLGGHWDLVDEADARDEQWEAVD